MMNRKVIDALEAVRNAHPQKRLLASAVVAEAEDDSSPLHTYFTWDDDKAGHQWRIHQARTLIASIEIISDSPAETVPKFVSLASDRRVGGYRETNEVMSDDGLRQELLQTALSEFTALRFRYQRFTEFAKVFDEVAKVSDAVKKRSKAAAK